MCDENVLESCILAPDEECNLLQFSSGENEVVEDKENEKIFGNVYPTQNDVFLEITIKESNSIHYKNLFNYLNETNVDGVFVFSNDGRLKYTQSDGNINIINVIEIKFDKTDFIFKSPTNKSFVYLPTNIGLFKDQLYQIPRKHSFKIFKQADEEFIYFAQLKDGQNDSFGKMCLTRMLMKNFNLPEYNLEKIEEPTCKITPKELAKKLGFIKGNKNRKYVTIKGFYRGISLEYSTMDKSNENFVFIGDVNFRPDNFVPTENIENEYIVCIKVSISIIRSLIKLVGLTSDNTKEIKIYVEKGKPIKLVTDVTSQGSISIYLNDCKDKL